MRRWVTCGQVRGQKKAGGKDSKKRKATEPAEAPPPAQGDKKKREKAWVKAARAEAEAELATQKQVGRKRASTLVRARG